jgi:light-regulated signal transduction histidine kinase (bacteriophytochrome)
VSADQLEVRRRYRMALERYLRDGGEAALSAAYELGRITLGKGLGLLEVVAMHHEALALLVAAAAENDRTRLTRAADEYFCELISPYEMAFRGYREANHKLQGLNEALRRQKDEVEQVNQELEAFSYSISHDLRAPLRSMDGFSQALLEDYAENLDATGQKYLNNIRAAAQRMAQLIDDILELARVARGALHTTRVDLSELARDVVEELRQREPGRQVEVVIEDLVFGYGDARLLGQVLENLLGNAWKYSSRRELARISFGQEPDASGRPVYFVRDNGAGFDMAYASKLFGLFQRLHSPSEFEGTGVGLATVQRIIHRHGGKVWAESEVDRGSTFYFTLGAPPRATDAG